MSIDLNILKQNPELAKNIRLEVMASDLIQFAEAINKQAEDRGKLHQEIEEFLTPKQVAEMLQVSLVTLWDWDKKGILSPHKIATRKFYKRSEIEKILNN